MEFHHKSIMTAGERFTGKYIELGDDFVVVGIRLLFTRPDGTKSQLKMESGTSIYERARATWHS